MPYQYAESSGMGWYAEPAPLEGYGRCPGCGYAEAEPYGYAEPEFADWGETDAYAEADPGYAEYEPVGYYAEELPMGEAEPYGYYAEPEYGEWGEPEYAEYEPVGYAEDPYGEGPEMVGYGEADPFGEEGPGAFAEPDYAGYVRDVPPPFNAGCPLPTNVAGYGEVPLDGYVRPAEVSPVCERFTPQPGPTAPVPETFRPLW